MKNFKDLLILLYISAAAYFTTYAMTAFVLAKANPIEWTVSERFLMLFFGIICHIFFVGFYVENYSKK